MSPLRSVGARLSLALAIVVAVALGVVYAFVAPLLEQNLIDAKLDVLTRAALDQENYFPDPGLLGESYDNEVRIFVDLAADATNTRVVLLRPLAPSTLTVVVDSLASRSAPSIANDPVALRAALGFADVRGVVEREGKRYAEVAYPPRQSFGAEVLLFSASLDDTLANVELVERRMLTAGAIALVVALLLGYGGTWVFARRIRRLERAADRIAEGQLEEPVVDRGRDELGQLAQTFERMRRRLLQLEHARREFIANASHELRTPIFSLGGFIELLGDEDLDEATRREFLATMQEQIERLTKLATDLLDLSRLDAGRLRIAAETLELGELAETLAEEFAAVALAGDHPLAVDVEDDVLALGDEQRVLQIGRILVENALRHTPPGTPVNVRVERRGTQAALAVEDAGPGISAEHAGNVFERFYRIDGSRASGSGLGLAIARELAGAMGGTLELESRPGRSVFALRLPATAAERPLAALGASR